jgi:hypothetical protein
MIQAFGSPALFVPAQELPEPAQSAFPAFINPFPSLSTTLHFSCSVPAKATDDASVKAAAIDPTIIFFFIIYTSYEKTINTLMLR